MNSLQVYKLQVRKLLCFPLNLLTCQLANLRTVWGLWVPSALIALFMAAPLAYLLYQGLSVEPELWLRLWRTRLPQLLLNTFALTATVTMGALALGLLLAWLVERTDLPGRRLLKPLLIAPLILPCYLVAIVYAAFFGKAGLLEKFFLSLGLRADVPNLYGFGGAALVLILATYPYVYTIVGAALKRLDPALEEAARVSGAGRLKTFWRVTLPLLFPALSAGGALAALYVLSDFGVVSTMRYQTFITAVYVQMTGRYELGAAAALSVVLIAFTVFVLWTQGFLLSQRRYAPEKPLGRTFAPAQLGLFKCPVLMVLGAGLLLPLGVLVYWLFEGLPALFNHKTAAIWGTSGAALARYALNSFTASAAAATLAIGLGLPLAYLTVRYRSGQGLGWLAQAGVALPGVLVALGLAFVLQRFVPVLYFSAGAVVLAYVVRFFPQAVQSLQAGLQQIPIRLEESARLLGNSPLFVFWRVTRPLLTPALLAGWTLVFLNALRELPATLLLRPAGFDTLPVRVWIASSEGFYAQAAPAALLLVGLSVPLLFLLSPGGTKSYD